MPDLLFFSRVALLCNACFLAVFFMHYVPNLRNGIVPSTIIILGNVVSIVINTLLMVLYASLALAGKFRHTRVPVWLWLINFLFFVFQVILLMK